MYETKILMDEETVEYNNLMNNLFCYAENVSHVGIEYERILYFTSITG